MVNLKNFVSDEAIITEVIARIIDKIELKDNGVFIPMSAIASVAHDLAIIVEQTKRNEKPGYRPIEEN